MLLDPFCTALEVSYVINNISISNRVHAPRARRRQKMANTIDLKGFINQFNEVRRLLLNRLKKDGVSRVNIWGTGLSGEVVSHLLGSSQIEISNVYDSFQAGEFLGRPIKNPFREIQPDVPVVVASTREPGQLEEVTGFLKSKKIPFYLINLNAEARLDLRDFRDKHKGSRCFVIGNGPSLNQLDMGKLKDEITIGANRCFLGFDQWGFIVKYWTIEDKLVADDIQDQWNEFSGPVKFVPNDLRHLLTNYNNVCLFNFTRESFDRKGVLPGFSDHPAELFWGGTVTYLMMQLAVVLGCNPIYLIGVDFHYVKPDHVTEGERKVEWTSHGDDPNHFHPDYFGKDRKWHDPKLPRMRNAYISAKRFADKKGITILNATPGTRLDVYEKVDYNSLF
jgi:hypothetical protein